MQYLTKFFIFFILILFFSSIIAQESLPYQNPDLSFDKRVDDLLSRMTLEEKVSQMLNDAPAIERLDIPKYNWWNECLHGVARADIATVFPQAIGLGATWNPQLIKQVATAISDEARAKHHEYVRRGVREIYKGLTMWSPNINIFRDPRWGRGQETYGEDPYLTSRIAVSFVKGLQGNHPKYLKLVSTPKHYAVHSGPEPARHHFNAMTTKKDLYETYLPAFKATVQEADAYSVMGAYNRYLGDACCASELLLDEILRDNWGFKGYVVSDCGAINDIFAHHKMVDSRAKAAAIAVKAGCDLNCGYAYNSLVEAVKQGFITEEEINVSVRRLLKARFKLGMFDPSETVPYAQIPISKLDCEEHRKLALQAARESLVLLKNEEDILPLDKSLSSIAVIGPNAESLPVLLGNYHGTPSYYVSVLDGIKNRAPKDTEINYTKGCNLAGNKEVKTLVPEDVFDTKNNKGLTAKYYDNPDLQGKPITTRREENIDANWYFNPVDGLPKTNFSVQWTGSIEVDDSDIYQFALEGDNGFRFYLDDSLIFESWQDQSLHTMSGKYYLKAGKEYPIKVEYYHTSGWARLNLKWARPNQDSPEQAIQLAQKSDAIIFVGGISAQLEGEEMDIDYEGFEGGDRTDLKLPQVQTELLKKLHKTGKPIIFVDMSGSAMAINWEKENIPAIVQAWYPGQEGGNAIADVIFGNYNPSGKLPVTFYTSVQELPPFEEYNMHNRTYKYYNGEPLFPFGHGLSFSDFEYNNLQLHKNKIESDQKTEVTVDVTNTGELAGQEVIQLYIKDKKSSVDRPQMELKGFKKVNFKTSETKKISFEINSDILSFYDIERDKYVVKPGKFEIMVGSSSKKYKKVVLEVK